MKIHEKSGRTVLQKHYMLLTKWMVLYMSLQDPGGKTHLYINLNWTHVSRLESSSSIGIH